MVNKHVSVLINKEEAEDPWHRKEQHQLLEKSNSTANVYFSELVYFGIHGFPKEKWCDGAEFWDIME